MHVDMHLGAVRESGAERRKRSGRGNICGVNLYHTEARSSGGISMSLTSSYSQIA